MAPVWLSILLSITIVNKKMLKDTETENNRPFYPILLFMGPQAIW